MNHKYTLNEPSISYSAMDDINAYHIIKAIKNGIQFNFFEKLTANISFSLREWACYLHLSERSMQRYKKERGRFSASTSEKIVSIAMLNKYGVEVFGNQESFNIWLNAVNLGMGNIKPKSLLDSSFGIQMIKEELTRIEYGILS